MAGFLLAAAPGTAPAGAAAPSQVGGDEVAVYQPGWTWTYNQTYTIDSPAVGTTKLEYFNIDESVTYTVVGVESYTRTKVT